MKNSLCILVLTRALLVSPTNGNLRTGANIRSTAARHALTGTARTQKRWSAQDAPSCQLFNEMLRRIYYMHSRLDAVTDSLGTIGYTPGREWEMDQGIGVVTAATLEQVVCPLLAGPPEQAPPSFLSLGERRSDPKDGAASRGCPPKSPQLESLRFLREEFKGTRAEGEKLGDVRAIFVDLLKSLENSLMSLYRFRECPLGTGGEWRTRQICDLHREEQAKALKLYQSDIPAMEGRLRNLKSRVSAIDKGTSSECYKSKAPAEEPHSDRRAEFCRNITAVTDALLDGRKKQKQWLNVLGDDMQRLGIMSMQLRRRVQDPVLKRDKIPLNALKALTRNWKSLESPMQLLRMMGSKRAEHAGSVDGAVLGIAGFLKNVSNENGCIAESFRLRYSARSCQSLRTQLESAVQERETDVEVLRQNGASLLVAASKGLNAKNCTEPAMTEGCWIRLPKGCPKIPEWKAANKWTRDLFGEESTGSGDNSVVCLTSRKLQMDLLCGVEDTETRFIPGKPA